MPVSRNASINYGFLTLQLAGPDQACDRHEQKVRRITRSGINITDHHQSTYGIDQGRNKPESTPGANYRRTTSGGLISSGSSIYPHPTYIQNSALIDVCVLALGTTRGSKSWGARNHPENTHYCLVVSSRPRVGGFPNSNQMIIILY